MIPSIQISATLSEAWPAASSSIDFLDSDERLDELPDASGSSSGATAAWEATSTSAPEQPKGPASEPESPDPVLWGKAIDLARWLRSDSFDDAKMAESCWDFTTLALADKADLPVPAPGGAVRGVGVRFWLDALAQLEEAGGLDGPSRRFSTGLKRFWSMLHQPATDLTEQAIEWLRDAPLEEGIRSPLAGLFFIRGDGFNHFQGTSMRYLGNDQFSFTLVDLCPPRMEREFLGQREAATYRFPPVSEQELRTFLNSPMGRALLTGDPFACGPEYDVTHRLDFYLGRPRPVCYPWALQQLQWSNSCCPKSLSALLRNEYTLADDPGTAIDNLYRYKILKGRVSRCFLQMMERIEASYPDGSGTRAAVLQVLKQRVELRCRYQPLVQAVEDLQLSSEGHHAVLVRTISAVAAVLGQAKQLPRAGSPESWRRHMTLQAPMTKATLTNLAHLLANLAVAHAAEGSSEPQRTASIVAAAVLHWADRMIRPIDEGRGGSLVDVPSPQRVLLDLRTRICFTALKHLKSLGSGERNGVKRFFKILRETRWSKAPTRAAQRGLVRESPQGSMREGNWVSQAPQGSAFRPFEQMES